MPKTLPVFTLMAMFLLATPAVAQEWPNSVIIMGKTLVLKHKEEKPEGLLLEYISADETLERWSVMFAMRHMNSRMMNRKFDPKVAAQQTVLGIQARKKQDPVANGAVFSHKDGKSEFADFVISAGSIIEHNVFRYFQTATGLTSYQLARRVNYQQDGRQATETLLKSIQTDRAIFFDSLMRIDMPVPE